MVVSSPFTSDNQGVRLHKLIADRGICSRRKAEELIRRGKVRINGKTAEIGQKAHACKDSIFIDNRRLQAFCPKRLTLIVHKPKGVLCTNSDPFHDKTIFNLLPPQYQKESLFCAGRLDKDTEGLVVLTNDGILAHRLMHPSCQTVKRYRVTLDAPLDPQKVPRLLNGIISDGECLKFDKVLLPRQKSSPPSPVCEIRLCHGRKREIRRLFRALNYRVERLIRFQVGGLCLRGLPRGAVRALSHKEIDMIATFESSGR